jgi:putative DNA primase/helicase
MAKKKARADAWKSSLQRKANLSLYPSLANAILIFANDLAWKDILAFDEFIGDIVSRKLPPWPKHSRPAKFKVGDWTDNDTANAAAWLDLNYDMYNVPVHIVGQALKVVAACRIVHPIREWLRTLTWDGVPRVNSWLCRIGGSADTAYVRAVAKNYLIGAVARVYKPGSQVDSMPVFEGKQGVRKTSMLQVLFSEQWFMSFSGTIGDKDSYQVLLRKWGVEFGELDALSKSQVSTIKRYITERTSRYRPSYGSKAQDFAKQCVFAGTTNRDDYLKDVTGNRRFWPVKVPGIKLPDGSIGVDLKLLAVEREQLWAEAVHRYKKGETWYFTEAELVKTATEEAQKRQESDIFEEPIAAWLFDETVCKSKPGVKKETFAERRARRGVTTHQVAANALKLDVSQLQRNHEMRIADVLRTLGWEGEREYSGGLTTRVFRPISSTRTRLKLVSEPIADRGVRQTTGKKADP